MSTKSNIRQVNKVSGFPMKVDRVSHQNIELNDEKFQFTSYARTHMPVSSYTYIVDYQALIMQ